MIEIENAFLGSLIKEPDNLEVLGKASRNWFSGNNMYVFDAILFLFNNGMGIEKTTVVDKLSGMLGDKYKDSIISTILESDFNPKNFETYQIRLEEEHLRKMMVSELHESILRIEKASPGEIKDIVDDSEGKIFQVSQDVSTVNRLRKMGDVGIEVMAEVRSYKEGGVIPYVSNTGLIDLDNMMGGFAAGDYTMLAATPSQGKTALALQILRNNLADGRSVGMISLEMTRKAVFLRHISSEAQIDSLRIRTGNVTSNEFDKCVAAWKRINEMPFYIDDSYNLNEVNIRGIARRMVKMYGINLLVIDFIQEMSCSERKESRQQEITKISRSLKNMAKELELPILVLSQLSRESVRRNPPIPRLSDLRESGSLEQDADNVIFIYRPEQYGLPVLMDGVTPSTNSANLIVGKARNGRTGNTIVRFQLEHGTFENAYQGEEPERKNEEIDN
jgi:replicative DNA helicase